MISGQAIRAWPYLKELPASVIKIDQHFVAHLGASDEDSTPVEAIIALGRKLQYELIAEGIETEVPRQALLAKGCTQEQGYYFSPPVSVDIFEKNIFRFLTDHQYAADRASQ